MRQLALIAILLAALSQAARADVDTQGIDWISGLPGVTVVNIQKSPHQIDAFYTVQAAADTFNAVLQELRRKQWRLGNVSDVENSRASIRTVQASRENWRMVVGVSNGRELGGPMHVRLSDKGDGGTTINVIPGDFGVSQAVVNQDGQTRTIDLQGSQCMVSGNKNNLTLTGSIPCLTVNGSDNVVTVSAAVARIEVNGQRNTVRWSTGRNPNAPSLLNNGQGNQIVTMP